MAKQQTMQQIHGTNTKWTCYTCNHYVKYKFNQENFERCYLFGLSNKKNISRYDTACGKWEPIR
jgi:hypothetical protein